MSDFIGVTAFSLPSQAELKQLALLFDRVGVPGLRWASRMVHCANEFDGEERELLADKGLLFEATVEVSRDISKQLKRIEHRYADEPNYFTRLVATALRSHLSVDAVAIETNIPLGFRRYFFELLSPHTQRAYALCGQRCDSDVLSRFDPVKARRLQICNLEPRYRSDETSKKNRSPVAEIVLKRFPCVDAETPWERIIEFRNDQDVRRQRDQLRGWMRKVVARSSSPIEIAQELDDLLSDYEAYMRVHELSVKHGVMQTLVVGTATMLEDLVKLKWGKLAESLFAVRQRRVTLMKEELKAPGREVSYVLTVNRAFRARSSSKATRASRTELT